MKRALLLLLFLAGAAEARIYRIEKEYSVVEFRIRRLVSRTEGHFTDFEGVLNYDPAQPQQAHMDVTLRPGSVDTRNKPRDKHLRGQDFFDVARYPTARYVSRSVTPMGPDQLQVDGFLTLRGITQPVSLNVKLRGAATDDIGRARAGFSAETRINRKDFGITWNETLDNGGLLLGDDVDLEMEIDAVEK